MDWEQKAAALNGLGHLSVCIRSRGNWYAACNGVGVTNGYATRHIYGRGKTPTEAIEDYWKLLMNPALSGKEYKAILVRRASGSQCMRWNGFMWESVAYPGKKEASGA